MQDMMPFREIGQGLEDVEDVEVFDVFFGAFPYISLPRLMNNQTSWSLAVQDVQDGKGLCCIDLDNKYRVVFLTGSSQFQYQLENCQSANHSCCSRKSCY